MLYSTLFCSFLVFCHFLRAFHFGELRNVQSHWNINIDRVLCIDEMVWAAVSQITYSLRDQINSDDANFLYEDREIE